VLPAVEVPVPPEVMGRAVVREREVPVMAPVEVRLPVLREVEKRLVDEAVVEKKLVEVALPRVRVPEKVLLSESKEEEAAVMVMLEEPLKEVPLMFLAVWRVVAVPALPPMFKEEVATSRRLAPVGSEYRRRLPVMEVRPVPPLAMERVPVMEERVVVEAQVGTPLSRARTWPAVPVEVVARAEEPLP
jgi:hypothetical protein